MSRRYFVNAPTSFLFGEMKKQKKNLNIILNNFNQN